MSRLFVCQGKCVSALGEVVSDWSDIGPGWPTIQDAAGQQATIAKVTHCKTVEGVQAIIRDDCGPDAAPDAVAIVTAGAVRTWLAIAKGYIFDFRLIMRSPGELPEVVGP